MKHLVKSFGNECCFSPTDKFEKTVSVSYDSVEHDPDAEVKVFVHNEHSAVNPYTIPNVLDNYESFDLILSWSDELKHLPNFQKFIFGDCWIDFDTFKPQKGNQVSFITSNKSFTPGHKMRLDIWSGLDGVEELNGMELLKHMSPPRVPNKNFIFEKAKYSIVVENVQCNNMITEKLIDCLATKTIPIYWGAPNVGDYFNTKGILSFNTLYELKDILDNLQESFYDNNLDIIEENYEESKKYWGYHDSRRLKIENFIEDQINSEKFGRV